MGKTAMEERKFSAESTAFQMHRTSIEHARDRPLKYLVIR